MYSKSRFEFAEQNQLELSRLAGSEAEYLKWFQIYIRRLASDGYKAKIQEVLDELSGPPVK